MRRASLGTLFVLLILIAAPVALAQKLTGPKYDPAAEFTIKGTVTEVKEVPKACLGEDAINLVLKTAKGPMEVQIAPASFLKELEITFKVGDDLQIIAAKAKEKDDKEINLAREIQHENNTLVVRDKTGDPVWTWMKKG